MKKIVTIFLITICLFLTACTSDNISETLFIASIGIEKEEDELVGYFYLPLSNDIGKSESTDSKGQGEYAKVKGQTIADLFSKVEQTISLSINFRHVSSIVFNKNLMNETFIKNFLDFVKFSYEIDFNCYIFTTEEKLSDIYCFKNPNQESVLNSMLVSSSDANGVYLICKPPHLLEFARKFYANRSILIPLIVLEEIWNVDDKEVKNFHVQNAIYYYKDKTVDVKKDKGGLYLKNDNKFEDVLKGESICFERYKLALDLKKNPVLKVSFNYQIYCSQTEIKTSEVTEHVLSRLNNYINKYKQFDPLELNYYSTVYKKDFNYDNLEIKVDANKN